MKQRSLRALAFALAFALAASFSGCEDSSARQQPVMVFENLGLLCVGPGPAGLQGKLLVAIEQAAKVEGLTRLAMESVGSPELSRTHYEFADSSDARVSLDFVDRSGLDLRVMVSADDPLRERFTLAVWDALMPQLSSK